jgi:two-component system CheB/CheR fusion protein
LVGRTAGITAHDTAPRQWTAAEIALIKEAAERAWDAIERSRAEQALPINEKRLQGQNEAFQAAINGAPLETSLGILARMVAAETGGSARTAFYIAEDDHSCLHPIPGAGDTPDSYKNLVDGFPIGYESLACGLASASGRPV